MSAGKHMPDSQGYVASAFRLEGLLDRGDTVLNAKQIHRSLQCTHVVQVGRRAHLCLVVNQASGPSVPVMTTV